MAMIRSPRVVQYDGLQIMLAQMVSQIGCFVLARRSAGFEMPKCDGIQYAIGLKLVLVEDGHSVFTVLPRDVRSDGVCGDRFTDNTHGFPPSTTDRAGAFTGMARCSFTALSRLGSGPHHAT